jgi:dienelactone hydrolase
MCGIIKGDTHKHSELMPESPSRGNVSFPYRAHKNKGCTLFKQLWMVLSALIILLASAHIYADPVQVPQNVAQIAADFDPRKDPLDVHLIREWKKEGVIYRSLTYFIGSFKGKPAVMAAFYAFPAGGSNLPALLQIHGGGQRAFLKECEFCAKHGYACLSINWGGRPMEEAQPGDPNTDWGAVDPTQQNVPGYFNLKPGGNTIDSVESPRNNNWYLLTLGARRGITFLERQPEVDPKRLGVYGISMGGSITVYVAGTDSRVRACVPSVGGSGFRTEPWPYFPQQPLETPTGDVGLFKRTLGFESYAPHIKAPILWMGATNDFHGIMDDTYRTSKLIPHKQVRFAFTPHMNHRMTPEFAVTRFLWFDHYLKGNAPIPETPRVSLSMSAPDGIPGLRVVPDPAKSPVSVQVYYSQDADPRARFWRSAEVHRDGNVWTAALPVMSKELPLFAFANVTYSMAARDADPWAPQTDIYTISSELQYAQLKTLPGIKATEVPDAVIDDFTHNWRDWFVLNPGNPDHWEYSTRKINDPKWQGNNNNLSLTAVTEKPNTLILLLTENLFRPYRGTTKEYVTAIKLTGGDTPQTITLKRSDFKAEDGSTLKDWHLLDLLTLRGYYETQAGKLIGSKTWAGRPVVFRKLWWSEP